MASLLASQLVLPVDANAATHCVIWLTEEESERSGVNIEEKWKEKLKRARKRECRHLHINCCCYCGSPLLYFSFVLLMTHGADIQAAGRVQGGRGDGGMSVWAAAEAGQCVGSPQKKNDVLYIYMNISANSGHNVSELGRNKSIEFCFNWNVATVSIMWEEEGEIGGERETELAKVAEGSHLRSSVPCSFSRSPYRPRTLAISLSNSFCRSSSSTHNQQSVCMCVCVSDSQSRIGWCN